MFYHHCSIYSSRACCVYFMDGVGKVFTGQLCNWEDSSSKQQGLDLNPYSNSKACILSQVFDLSLKYKFRIVRSAQKCMALCYAEWKVRKRKTNMVSAFWLSFWLHLYFSALICVKSLFLIKGTPRQQARVQGGGRVLSVLCTSWVWARFAFPSWRIPSVTPNHFSSGGRVMFCDANCSYLF